LQAASGVYASPAVGPPGQPDFLNAAAVIETDLAPLDLRRRLRQIEAALGRARPSDRYAPRTIDLDIVLYDDLVLDAPPLRIPDPDLLERAYLATAVSELDPTFPHPETGEPLAALAARLAEGTVLTNRPDVVLRTAGQDSDGTARDGRA
jgi:2-amino-4-hydroxy-6-hydroxymethyldihydropteridine diphosphokinase